MGRARAARVSARRASSARVLGPRTVAAVVAYPPRLVNNGLVAERVRFFADIVAHDASQLKWFHGWCVRAVSYLV